MQLPIEVIAGTSPPQFRWRQTLDTPVGVKVIDQEGHLPVGVDTAVAQLVRMAHQMSVDNAALRGQNQLLVSKLESALKPVAAGPTIPAPAPPQTTRKPGR